MEELLSVENLTKTYRVKRGLFKTEEVRALRGVSFTLFSGEVLALVGESGSGKSTVGKIVLRLEKPTGGRVLFMGRDAFKWDRAYTRLVSVVFQDPRSSLNPRMTVYEIVKEPLVVHRVKNADERVREVIRRVGLSEELLYEKPPRLSGGQAQRVAVARAVVLEPKLVVADEPTASLDLSVQAEVINLFKELNEKGIAFLFITHDVRVVEKVAHRVAVLYAGLLMELGPKEKVLKRPLHPYTRLLLESVPARHPRLRRPVEGLEEEEFTVPEQGCPFLPRCKEALPECSRTVRRVEVDDRAVFCNLY
ncbi:MAG: ABC transporter ATP-binding protein [Aquificae bacterium]|nr:ABC transporter ATP-binding protein [Aquificota bacterium]